MSIFHSFDCLVCLDPAFGNPSIHTTPLRIFKFQAIFFLRRLLLSLYLYLFGELVVTRFSEKMVRLQLVIVVVFVFSYSYFFRGDIQIPRNILFREVCQFADFVAGDIRILVARHLGLAFWQSIDVSILIFISHLTLCVGSMSPS